MKQNRINATVAVALADQVIDNLKKESDNKADVELAKVKSSSEWAQFTKLVKEIEKLEKQIPDYKKALQKKYPSLCFSGYGKYLDLQKKSNSSLLDLREIKTQIILANHVDNVPPNKLVAHVTAQLLKKK